ncbi:MAG: phosphotransferase [Oscillospiraceae bacterium]|nr:phosphotransferase [Oscillospiraceae bacterium]
MKELFALMEQCGLGMVEGQIEPVSGGLMHRMYKVQTTTGTYAVKCLNPEIMSRPDAMKNYAEAERLEKILECNGIPVVAALSFNNEKMVRLDGRYYYVFPWLEGKITDFDAISKEQCFAAGEILGRIHGIDAKSVSSSEPEINTTDFKQLLEEAKHKESVIAPWIEKNMEILESAQEKLNAARRKLPAMRAISNDDMDPKNIMWHDGKAYVIDLECLGYSNPVSSCLDLSLQWAGTVNGRFNKENLEAFFRGYLSAYDNGFRAYDELFGIAYTWIEWLEYNIRRALGMVSPDIGEIKLGESETEKTINRIKYLASIEADICSVLRGNNSERQIWIYGGENNMVCSSLEEVRENIDRIDNEIIKLIAERTTYVVQASSFKKDEAGVKDSARVEKVIAKVRVKAVEYGANQDMVEALYREMISRFINMEMSEFYRNGK